MSNRFAAEEHQIPGGSSDSIGCISTDKDSGRKQRLLALLRGIDYLETRIEELETRSSSIQGDVNVNATRRIR